jgi:hypothetical protein
LSQSYRHTTYFIDLIEFIWDEMESIGDEPTGRVSEREAICDTTTAFSIQLFTEAGQLSGFSLRKSHLA